MTTDSPIAQAKNETVRSERSSKKLVLFIISFVVAFLGTYLLKDDSFSEAQEEVFFLLLFSVSLWLTEAVPAFAAGMFIIVFLVFTQGFGMLTDTPRNLQYIQIYLNTFSSSVIWLMLGGFFLAAAMTKTRLDVELIQLTLRVSGKDPKWILFAMMLVTMTISMLISNTAATAMVIASLMPLITQIGKLSPVGKGLILGIPIAATTGGMGTIIGSPPNAVAAGVLATAGHPVNFVQWIYYGLPIALLLTLFAWMLLVRLFMRNAEPFTMTQLVNVDKASDPNSRLQRIIVMIVLAVTLALWLTNPLHGLSAAAVSAVPLVALTLSGVLKNEDVRGVGWDTLLLVAGGLALGTGLQQTGLLEIYSRKIAVLPVSHTTFYFLLAYATML
ncbi:MAG TPA: SLC13 family permease, partial [Cyclobacteriaceae bacterium]|nr:SLC13 family permease [Cyclobacteriaceae bacterium]